MTAPACLSLSLSRPRLCAIALPELRIEMARGLAREGQPLAVVIARARGAVRDEASLLGNTRLDEVSSEARALGVRAGQTIAAARARTAELAVRVVHVDAVNSALASLAEAALAFGAHAYFEAGGVAGDVVWCDVTGCAHLFAGERALAQSLAAQVRAMGHACRLAIADGPRIAAAAARFAPASKPGPLLIPPGKGAMALHRLPLVALPLGGEAIAWLGKLGVRTAGDLARLPRASLGTRLGIEGSRVMQLLGGDDRERLPPYVPPEVPEERAELEYGIAASEALVFVVKRLADRLSPRLAGRCSKARRLELVLSLDRALLPPDERENPTRTLEVNSPAPLATVDELLRVLRARIESYEIEAPILAVTLRALQLVTSEGQPLDLLVPEARAERALPRLGAELVAELGEGRVGTFALCDSWIPEERARLVSLSQAAPARARPALHHALLSGAPEPSRLLRGSLSFRESESHTRTLLERIEAVEWWKRGPRSKSFLAAWLEDRHAMAWLEVDPEDPPRLRGWMD
jgi:protein ImuB